VISILIYVYKDLSLLVAYKLLLQINFQINMNYCYCFIILSGKVTTTLIEVKVVVTLLAV